jgi:hypothetical protein
MEKGSYQQDMLQSNALKTLGGGIRFGDHERVITCVLP